MKQLYKINQCIPFMDYLKEDFKKIIPIEQRSFEWKTDTCIKLVQDIYNNFIHKKNFHLGIIMCYFASQIDCKEKLIYDGQQRTICLTLLLKSICNYLKENNHYKDNHYIQSIITEFESNFYVPNKNLTKTETDELKNGVRTPKITSIINELDKKSIKFILNIKDKSNFNISIEKGEYNTNSGSKKSYTHYNYNKTKIQTLPKLKKKLLIEYPELGKIIDNNIVKSFLYIDFEINAIFKKLDVTEIENFIRFLDSDIFIDLYDIYDLEHANNLFENINSKGQAVSKQTILKNILINSLHEENDKLQFVTKLNNKIDKIENIKKKYSITIDFNKILQLILSKHYNFNKLEFPEYISTYEKLFKNKSLTMEIFLNYFDQINNAIDELSNNKWIKILSYSKRLLSYEAWKNLLIPIYFKNNSILQDVIYIIVKYEIRVMFRRTKTFNSFEYSIQFKKIIERNNDICKELTQFFVNKLKENNIYEKDKYLETLTVNISDKKIKAYLMYYEYFSTTDITNTSLSDLDKEHIIPKSSIEKHGNQDKDINNIGNLTLLESKNSISGNNNKGNRSIQDKTFKEKLPIYKESNIRITNKLSEYDIFDTDSIEKRRNEIGEFMFDKSKFLL